MADNHIALTLSLPCSAQRAWDEMTNWERQGEWMLQTSVWLTSEIETGPVLKLLPLLDPCINFFHDLVS